MTAVVHDLVHLSIAKCWPNGISDEKIKTVCLNIDMGVRETGDKYGTLYCENRRLLSRAIVESYTFRSLDLTKWHVIPDFNQHSTYRFGKWIGYDADKKYVGYEEGTGETTTKGFGRTRHDHYWILEPIQDKYPVDKWPKYWSIPKPLAYFATEEELSRREKPNSFSSNTWYLRDGCYAEGHRAEGREARELLSLSRSAEGKDTKDDKDAKDEKGAHAQVKADTPEQERGVQKRGLKRVRSFLDTCSDEDAQAVLEAVHKRLKITTVG